MAASIITKSISKALAADTAKLAPHAKAPKKAKAPVAPVIAAAPEAKVRVAWNHGKTVVHHAVRVGKATFTSTWKAFEGIPELATLSRGQHIKFRKALKAAGKLDFKDPKSGKTFPFEIVAE